MGRQTNFFMTLDDEIRLFEFLISSPDVIVYPGSELPEPKEVPLRSVDELRQSDTFVLYLRDRSVSPAPVIQESKHGFWVDAIESEVVEWSRSIEVDGRLQLGRIYIQTTRISQDDPHALERKSDEFLKWFDSLQRWIRRHAERCDDRWKQVMPGAAAYEREGGHFRS